MSNTPECDLCAATYRAIVFSLGELAHITARTRYIVRVRWELLILTRAHPAQQWPYRGFGDSHTRSENAAGHTGSVDTTCRILWFSTECVECVAVDGMAGTDGRHWHQGTRGDGLGQR